MPGIICAIRGGPNSRSTINKAVQVAQETNLPLHFLYVINLDFLVHTNIGRTHLITRQMKQMGEFILLTAQTKAEDKGIQAKGVIRKGKVVDEIIQLCHELEANHVILGLPNGANDDDRFTIEQLNHSGQRIESESGAKIIYVSDPQQ